MEPSLNAVRAVPCVVANDAARAVRNVAQNALQHLLFSLVPVSFVNLSCPN